MSDALPVKLPLGVAKLANVICGCASDSVWQAVIDELERCAATRFSPEETLVAHVVDHCGLSEHGTSIRGGWLTPAGEDALAFLRKWGADWHDKGEFLDDEGITWGQPAGVGP